MCHHLRPCPCADPWFLPFFLSLPVPCPPACQVCREAEISVVVKQSEEAQKTEYLKYGKPQE